MTPTTTADRRVSRLTRRGLGVVLALTLVLTGGALAAGRVLIPDPDGEVLRLLLLGSDDGPPRTADLRRARADGFQLLFVSADRRHATFVSIPRDSWVPIGGSNNRINACLNNGPDACVATAEQVFGLSLDGYVLTSMEGFRKAFEAFGGITVDVPTPVFDGGHDVPSAGVQHLTGAQALTYARDRKHRPNGDFDRSAAQAELLALAHAEVASAGDTAAVLEALTILRRHSLTDIPPRRLARLAFEALRLPPENVERVLAPARIGTAGAASVVFLDDDAYTLVTDAATDGRLAAQAAEADHLAG